MITEFVDRFMANKPTLEAKFSAKHPENYADIVRAVIEAVRGDDYGRPDPDRIHQIDDGAYQGTLVFVIAEDTSQPYRYWYVRVGYGSCSGCDTLQRICGYSNEKPTAEQVKDYMTLALHIVQGLHTMEGGD